MESGLSSFLLIADCINTGGGYTAKTVELWFETFLTHNKQVLYEQGDTTHGLNMFLDGDQLYVGAWADDSGSWINTTIAPGTIYLCGPGV